MKRNRKNSTLLRAARVTSALLHWTEHAGKKAFISLRKYLPSTFGGPSQDAGARPRALGKHGRPERLSQMWGSARK